MSVTSFLSSMREKQVLVMFFAQNNDTKKSAFTVDDHGVKTD